MVPAVLSSRIFCRETVRIKLFVPASFALEHVHGPANPGSMASQNEHTTAQRAGARRWHVGAGGARHRLVRTHTHRQTHMTRAVCPGAKQINHPY